MWPELCCRYEEAGIQAFKDPLFEERVKVSVDEKSDGFFVGMLFIPGRAGPEQGLDDTEGVFGESGQFRPLWIRLDRGSKCNAFRVGIRRKEVIGYLYEGFYLNLHPPWM